MKPLILSIAVILCAGVGYAQERKCKCPEGYDSVRVELLKYRIIRKGLPDTVGIERLVLCSPHQPVDKFPYNPFDFMTVEAVLKANMITR